MNARIDTLKIFVTTDDRHSRIICITLQETCCDESTDMTKCNLPGYTMITKFNGTEVSNHGGLIIYVHDDFSFGESKEIIHSFMKRWV